MRAGRAVTAACGWLVVVAWLLLGLRPAQAETLGPEGGRVVSFRFESDAIAGLGTWHAYLPPGYRGDATVRFPYIVALHGLLGRGDEWFSADGGDLLRTLDSLISTGMVIPLVVIAPDGRDGYWTNHAGRVRGTAWGAYVDEVDREALAKLKLDPKRRAIAGVSMGGHGALSIGLRSLGAFRAIVSMSGALFPEPPTHRPIYGKVWGDPIDYAHWLDTAPMALIRRADVARAAPPIWLECGQGDVNRFLSWNVDAFEDFCDAGLDVSLHLNKGGHGWKTWRAVNKAWLQWVSRILARY